SNDSWGGYAEARANLSSAALQNTIDHFSVRPPLLPITGLFGIGWDDVSYTSTSLKGLAQSWNTAHGGGDHVRISSITDYFTALDRADADTDSQAATALAAFFATPNETRFVVFNALGFARTDFVDLPIAGPGPYVVTDVATASEVPSQVVTVGGSTYLRVLASN